MGERVVSLRLTLSAAVLRSQVKRAGGLWEPQRRGWALRSDRLVALELAQRIVEEARV